MQAVILAAGRSTRTYPLTETRPKPLIPVWGRPFLEYQLRQLPAAVSEVLLVVGYLREQIEAHFGAAFEGRSLRYVTQEQQRGTADALLAARPFLDRRCLVLNGDDFYHGSDLQALVQRGRGLLVTRASDPQNRAVVSVEDDRIVAIVEKPPNPEPGAWCSVGGYCIEPDDLPLLDELAPSVRGELELPDFVLSVVRRHPVRPLYMKHLWIPLTYAWDALHVMNRFWSDEDLAIELGLASSKDGVSRDTIVEGPVLLGDGVTLGRGVRLVGPVALGAKTAVGDGASIDNVVTFDGAAIGAGAVVEGSVIGARASVGERAILESRAGSALTLEIKGKTVIPDIDRLGAVVGDGGSVAPGQTVPPGTLIGRAS